MAVIQLIPLAENGIYILHIFIARKPVLSYICVWKPNVYIYEREKLMISIRTDHETSRKRIKKLTLHLPPTHTCCVCAYNSKCAYCVCTYNSKCESYRLK